MGSGVSAIRFKPAASAGKFIMENVNVAKHLIKGKLTAADVHMDIIPGEAKVAELDGKKQGYSVTCRGSFMLLIPPVPIWAANCSGMQPNIHGLPLSWLRFTYEEKSSKDLHRSRLPGLK